MPTQGDKIRILDPAQFQVLVKRLAGIEGALLLIGQELAKLNNLEKTEEDSGSS